MGWFVWIRCSHMRLGIFLLTSVKWYTMSHCYVWRHLFDILAYFWQIKLLLSSLIMPTASQRDLTSCISADCVFTFCSIFKIYAMCLLCRLLMFFVEETEDIDRNKWTGITLLHQHILILGLVVQVAAVRPRTYWLTLSGFAICAINSLSTKKADDKTQNK